MSARLILMLALPSFVALSACTPVVIGAGAAVVVDEVLEDRNGGDGLF